MKYLLTIMIAIFSHASLADIKQVERQIRRLGWSHTQYKVAEYCIKKYCVLGIVTVAKRPDNRIRVGSIVIGTPDIMKNNYDNDLRKYGYSYNAYTVSNSEYNYLKNKYSTDTVYSTYKEQQYKLQDQIYEAEVGLEYSSLICEVINVGCWSGTILASNFWLPAAVLGSAACVAHYMDCQKDLVENKAKLSRLKGALQRLNNRIIEEQREDGIRRGGSRNGPGEGGDPSHPFPNPTMPEPEDPEIPGGSVSIIDCRVVAGRHECPDKNDDT